MNLLLGDCIEHLSAMPDASIDAVVTDPPYELGFMGKHWDASGIANSVIWREVLRVLKPGGHMLAFGGTRTYHRMTCAIEDAGFEIRDSLHWMYGTGFPKSHACLKPAHEPIVLARKPLIGTVADNVKAHGTGAMNIDGCRISADEPIQCQNKNKNKKSFTEKTINTYGKRKYYIDCGRMYQNQGRWPSNILLDEGAAAELDEQSGESSSTGGIQTTQYERPLRMGRTSGVGSNAGGIGDTGGASRFFYVAKASRKERGIGNNHPTVKPIDLMRYLCRLITPPNGTVLDPFMGSGTTGIAAKAEGFDFVGIEREPEYMAIAERRIAAPVIPIKRKPTPRPVQAPSVLPKQMALFSL